MKKAEYNDFVKEVERITLSHLTEGKIPFERSKDEIHDIVVDAHHPEIGDVHIYLDNWANCKYKTKEPKVLTIYTRCETFRNEDKRVEATPFNVCSGKANILAFPDEVDWMLTRYQQLLTELFRDPKYNELTLS